VRRCGAWLGVALLWAGCAVGDEPERATGAWMPGAGADSSAASESGDVEPDDDMATATSVGEPPDDATAGEDGTTGGPLVGDDESTSGEPGDDDGSSSDGGGSTGSSELEPPPCPEPQMVHFPIGGTHNIGYDPDSCGTGTCEVSCPDVNANSDWNGPAGHHGVDLFAHYQAPLLAVADAEVVAVGVVSATSGLRVRMRDACGWEYYYGHLDAAMVEVGDVVSPGEPIGTMGATGTQSVHLHFNVSLQGNYSDDIDPFELLDATSPTACD